MLYVDGMNGVIAHNETICWLYELLDSPVSVRSQCSVSPMWQSYSVCVGIDRALLSLCSYLFAQSFLVFSSMLRPSSQK